MYCNICVSAFQAWPKDQDSESSHHASLQGLYNSAQFGCLVCVELLGMLQKNDGFDHPAQPSPCTKWRNKKFTDKMENDMTFFFGKEWCTACGLDPLRLGKGYGIDYSLVPVEAKEARQETNLTRRHQTWGTREQRQAAKQRLGESTNSQQTWSLIQGWVTRCNQRHNNCKSISTSLWFPRRLIAVGENNKIPHLYEPDIMSWSFNERYTTLSHRWGADSSHILKLVKENIDSLRQRIPMDLLPQTFRDAIDITRRLGVRYIWIDSLCILQDDEDDWRQEASQMGKIYSTTYLNISATSAENKGEGCYRDRDPVNVASFSVALIRSPPGTISWYTIVRKEGWLNMVDKAPLNQRGWVLQERILSPRVLHFSVDQVFWECRQHDACETFPKVVPVCYRQSITRIPLTKLRDFIPSQPVEAYMSIPRLSLMEAEYWSTVVQAYSRASLTRQTDKLVALSGVAREVRYLLKSTYLAGLWKCHFPICLLWRAKAGCHRPKEYLAPSWSWASVEGPIDLPCDLSKVSKFNYGRTEIATVLDVDIDLTVAEDPFGRVKGGWIQMKGRLAVASWQWPDAAQNHMYKTPIALKSYVPPSQARAEADVPEVFALGTDENDYHKIVYILLDDVESALCKQVFFLPIVASDSGDDPEGLLLQLLPTGNFSRLGMLMVSHPSGKNMLASFTEREIVIV